MSNRVALKAVCALNKEEYNERATLYTNILHANAAFYKDHPGEHVLVEYDKTRKYAAYGFRVTVHQDYPKYLGHMPTPLEVSMIVDGGFSYFGGYCESLTDNDYAFRGEIYID